jgi:hypothetical protein
MVVLQINHPIYAFFIDKGTFCGVLFTARQPLGFVSNL